MGIVAVGVVVLGAQPAAADPPAPTDYRSVIDSIEPAAAEIDVDVVGGDSFLRLNVDGGHEVVVAGYQGEPYLRFDDDGTVERNRRSPATYVNESRQGDADLPADADADAEPDWEEVATGGSYAWHDHRIHWMSSGSPPGERGDAVQDWTVDLTVDGRPTAITGRLLWVEAENPWPWVALGVVAAAATYLAGRYGRPGPVAAGATVLAAVIAVVVGTAQYTDAPAQGGTSPLVVVVPLVGLVAALAGIALNPRRPSAGTPSTAALIAAVAIVLGWGLVRSQVLWKPVLPTGLAYDVDRAGTALAMALATAAGLLVGLASALAIVEDMDREAAEAERD